MLQTVDLSLSAIINYIFISEKESSNLKPISAKIYVKYNLILLPFEKMMFSLLISLKMKYFIFGTFSDMII